jgi:hypothetical protein
MVLLAMVIQRRSVDSADITILKAGVDAILFSALSQNMNLQLELFE